jgi:hypothetical protein
MVTLESSVLFTNRTNRSSSATVTGKLAGMMAALVAAKETPAVAKSVLATITVRIDSNEKNGCVFML